MKVLQKTLQQVLKQDLNAHTLSIKQMNAVKGGHTEDEDGCGFCFIFT